MWTCLSRKPPRSRKETGSVNFEAAHIQQKRIHPTNNFFFSGIDLLGQLSLFDSADFMLRPSNSIHENTRFAWFSTSFGCFTGLEIRLTRLSIEYVWHLLCYRTAAQIERRFPEVTNAYLVSFVLGSFISYISFSNLTANRRSHPSNSSRLSLQADKEKDRFAFNLQHSWPWRFWKSVKEFRWTFSEM